MAQANMQLAQIIGTTTNAASATTGKTNTNLLGNRTQGATNTNTQNTDSSFQAFLSMLGNLQQSGNQTLSAMVQHLQSRATTQAIATNDPRTAALLQDMSDSAEKILAILKQLSNTQLTAIGIDPNALPDVQTLATNPSSLSILASALSDAATDMDGSTNISTLFTIINDPDLALSLQGAIAQLQSQQTDFADLQTALTQNTTSTLPNNLSSNTSFDFSALDEASDTLTTLSTLDIASLDSETFTELKRFFYSDIAPFLTEPTTISVSGDTVMQVAGGPAFLSDDSSNTTLMDLLAGLANASLIQQPIQQTPTNIGTTNLLTAQTNTPALNANTMGNLQNGAEATGQTSPFTMSATDARHAAQAEAQIQNSATSTTTTTTSSANIFASALANAKSDTTTSESLTKTDPTLNMSVDAMADDAAQTLRTTDSNTVKADQSSAASATSTLTTAKNAAQTHPATHLAAAALQSSVSNVTKNEKTQREFVIQLDPPRLGRLKVSVSFDEDGGVKSKFLTERPETLSLLKKDSQTLQRILQEAGFDTSANDAMTFEMAQDDSFSQNLNNSQNDSSYQSTYSNAQNGTEFALEEDTTVMPIFVDPATGLTHVNVVI